jgi:hypothetical protein
MAKTMAPVKIFISWTSVALILWTLANFWSPAVGQDVVGCGGFVRTNKNIDVTRIQVALFTKKGGNLR